MPPPPYRGLDTLRRHRPTTAFLVPTHLQRILQSPDLGADETFDSLRLLAHAGAPCPETVKRAIMERVRPGGVWEFYGSTEAQFSVCPPEDWLEHPGTVGRARPGRRLHIAPVPPTTTTTASATSTTPTARRRRHHLVRHARLRPLQLLGEPRGHGRRLERVGLHRRRPRPPRSGRLPLPDRPAPRPHHQRGRQRLSGRGRERRWPPWTASPRWPCSACPTSSGASGSAPPTWPTADGRASAEEALRAAAVGPARPVQAAQVVLRHRGPAPHGHRQAHTAGRPRAPGTGAVGLISG